MSLYRQAFKRLRGDESGTVAVVYALSVLGLVGMVALGVDFHRASNERTKAQAALDSALASSTAVKGLSGRERIALAERLYAGGNETSAMITQTTRFWTEGPVLKGQAELKIRTTFSQVLGIPVLSAIARSAAVGSDQSLEIVLALDVTGSMRNEMDGLRKASRSLAETIFREAAGRVRVGVVPFAASVNPGRDALPDAFIDSAGRGTQHGRNVEGHWVATGGIAAGAALPAGCNWQSTPLPSPGKSGNSDLGSLGGEVLERLLGLFAPGAAAAQSIPYPTFEPLSGTTSPYGRMRPAGFGWGVYCGTGAAPYEYLSNPGTISHAELYRRLPSVSWKGCVEARSEPFDITDDPPSIGNANTQFIPYFWFDDGQQNNWVDDQANRPAGWAAMGPTALFKYNPSSRLTIDEIAPATTGPNKGCPEPILPLQDVKSTVDSYIDALSHWDGGGTVISEGVGWAWRVLSPGAPFTTAQPYGQETRKIIVLMSDGRNELASASNTWSSAYTAYGALRWGRLPQPWTFADVSRYLDSRTIDVCSNAKRMGIEIYTVLYRENDPAVQSLMRGCANGPDNAFLASNAKQLEEAFTSIARSASRVRIIE